MADLAKKKKWVIGLSSDIFALQVAAKKMSNIKFHRCNLQQTKAQIKSVTYHWLKMHHFGSALLQEVVMCLHMEHSSSAWVPLQLSSQLIARHLLEILGRLLNGKHKWKCLLRLEKGAILQISDFIS